MKYDLKDIVLLVADEECLAACRRLREREFGILRAPVCRREADTVSAERALLYLTDDPHCAGALFQRGEPVLAVSHERNRDAGFSGLPYVCSQPEELDRDFLERVYRRARRLPWEILETERCLVRETTVEDVDAFYELYRDESVTRYTENLFADRDEEIRYMEHYIRQVYEFRGYGIWSVLEKESGRVIGRAGLDLRPGYEDPELGFVFGVPWQGKGLAREVCSAILDYAREELGFSRVQAFVRPENTPSVRLCERLGMRRADVVALEGVPHDRYMAEQSGDM